MEKSKITSILASFATMKSLFDTKSYQSPYQLLSEFISYVIAINKFRSFTAIEMRNRLQELFGFEVPEAVVRTSVRSLEFIKTENRLFIVDNNKLRIDSAFEKKMFEAESANTNIVDLLTDFVKKNRPSEFVRSDILTQEFVAFLIDDEPKNGGKYTELISQFILENEDDENIQTALTTVREGSILYIGLNHNINETGSIKKPLTLYLSTEVLFSLSGFNGEIHKRLIQDLFDQIKLANLSEKKISLRYFADTKQEIDDFFASAEAIVSGKDILSDKVAMKSIINGCDKVSEVRIKKADFYHFLVSIYEIKEDDIKDYYSDEKSIYNLETLTTDPSLVDNLKLISHINKLRKGRTFSSNIDAEYLFVTNSGNTLKLSRTQSECVKQENNFDFVCDYAISIEKITNLLWYKLGNGFGRKEYPSNVNAVLKARTLLALHISQNVSKLFSEVKSKYKAGDLTQEQLAARIVALRGKATIPEDLDAETIHEALDFSPEYLSRFEEEVHSNRNVLQEKERLLKTLESQNQQILIEKERAIAKKDHALNEAEENQKGLEAELEEYRLKEKVILIKKEKRRNIFLIIKSVLFKLLILVSMLIIVKIIVNKIDAEWTSTVSYVVGILGFVAMVRDTIRNDIKKYFNTD